MKQQSYMVVHNGSAGEPAETADHHCFFVAVLEGLACLEDLDLAVADLPLCRIWLRQFQKMIESARGVGVAREVCAEGRQDARSYEEMFWCARKCSQIESVQFCESSSRYGRTINRTVRNGSCNPHLVAFTTTNEGGVERMPRENNNTLKATLMRTDFFSEK